MEHEPATGDTFQPHEITWDRARSTRYWDFLSGHPSSRSNYFSQQVGDAILAYLRRHRVPLAGRVLDFGCGPGFLVERLARAGICCDGVDFSAASVEAARRRIAGMATRPQVTLATNLPTPLEAATFDTVVSLDSIEHVLPEDMESTFGEIRRVLRPTGTLVLTTPNEEDLGRSVAMCPECGCKFHRMQHVWSWSARSLSRTMEAMGWRTARAEAVLFRQNGARLARLKERLDHLRRRRGPHLVWIGRPAA